jgi:hypothetical protein
MCNNFLRNKPIQIISFDISGKPTIILDDEKRTPHIAGRRPSGVICG